MFLHQGVHLIILHVVNLDAGYLQTAAAAAAAAMCMFSHSSH
jgi:hypothetical protein